MLLQSFSQTLYILNSLCTLQHTHQVPTFHPKPSDSSLLLLFTSPNPHTFTSLSLSCHCVCVYVCTFLTAQYSFITPTHFTLGEAWQEESLLSSSRWSELGSRGGESLAPPELYSRLGTLPALGPTISGHHGQLLKVHMQTHTHTYTHTYIHIQDQRTRFTF